MATIITRVYKDEKAANAVADALHENGFAARDVTVVAGAKGDAADGIAERLSAAGVGSETAAAAAEKVSGGNAALVVAAPFGKALKAGRVVDEAKSVDLGIEKPDSYKAAGDMASDTPDYVLKEHPRFLTSSNYPGGVGSSKPFSSMFGMSMLSNRRKPDAVIRGGRHIFSAKTISNIRFGADLTDNHKLFSRMLSWPLLSGSRLNSQINQDNPTPFSSFIGWDTIIRR